jgi:hypothetical protein
LIRPSQLDGVFFNVGPATKPQLMIQPRQRPEVGQHDALLIVAGRKEIQLEHAPAARSLSDANVP